MKDITGNDLYIRLFDKKLLRKKVTCSRVTCSRRLKSNKSDF